jgi:hypothetical protein
MQVVRRRGNRQDLADRLDPINFAVIVNEFLHLLDGRSSSAWAKYADALRKISLACRNSLTSRSKALIRSDSLASVPFGLPETVCHDLIQRRRVSDVQPILAEMDWIVAHSEPYSLWCSLTIRTARSRTSGE